MFYAYIEAYHKLAISNSPDELTIVESDVTYITS